MLPLTQPRSFSVGTCKFLALALVITAASHSLAAAQAEQTAYPIPSAVPTGLGTDRNASVSATSVTADSVVPEPTVSGVPSGFLPDGATDAPGTYGEEGTLPNEPGGQPGGGSGAGGAGGGQYPGGAGGMGAAWRLPDWVASLPTVRIAHAVVGSVTVLFVFPFGATIFRVWDHRHGVWVHAGVQMFGYLLYLVTAAMGLWMGAVEKKLGGYHPIMGLVMLGLLTVQPFTELLNHFLFSRWPNVRYLGHGHLYVGRIVIAAGMIQGGLGFAYAAKIDREMPMRPGPYPRGVHITYGVLAGVLFVVYAAIIIWKQGFQNLRRMSETGVEEQIAEAERQGPLQFRIEEHPHSVVRATVRRASEVVQEKKRSASEGAVAPEVQVANHSSSALGEPAVSPTPRAPSRMSSVKKIFKSEAL